MKNYKVKAIRFFRDSNEIDEKTGRKIERKINDEFYCTKERYEFLKANNAVKLVEIFKVEKIEYSTLVDNEPKEIETIITNEIVEEEQEEVKPKPRKKKTSKK
jgi:hypothetical protein